MKFKQSKHQTLDLHLERENIKKIYEIGVWCKLYTAFITYLKVKNSALVM